MNSNEQAQKGFQTFVLTLSISLIIFSIIYYFVTNSTNQEPNIRRDLGEEVSAVENEVSMNENNGEEVSVFKKLADQEVNVKKRAVLAGASEELNETTQSTIPDTGSLGITFGLMMSLVLLTGSVLFMFKGPRSLAITKFEKQFFED